MPWGGSAPNEVYTRTDGTRTGSAVNVSARNLGVNDTAVLTDNRENDFATALNLVLKRDGGTQPTADLPMNGFKHTGLGLGVARTDGLRIDQVQDGELTYAEASGTANAIVLTTSPICGAVEGVVIGFFAEFDSSSTVTVKLNDDSALALQYIGAALVGGEIQNGQFHQVAFDGTVWQLVNPYAGAVAQPLDSDLTAIAALMSTNDDIIQRKGGVWSNRSMAQLIADLAVLGTTFQPLDSDLTAIAALTTTSFGRGFLAYADEAAFKAGVNLEAGVDFLSYSTQANNARLAMTEQPVTTASATLNIDMSLGWHVSLTLSHTITTLTVSNAPSSGDIGKITIDISSTGAFNISDWPGTTIWPGGSAPTITSGNGEKDTIILTTTDGGTNWRGYIAGQDMS